MGFLLACCVWRIPVNNPMKKRMNASVCVFTVVALTVTSSEGGDSFLINEHWEVQVICSVTSGNSEMFLFLWEKTKTKILKVDRYDLIRFGKRALTDTVSFPPSSSLKNNSCIDPHWENPFIYFLLCTHLYRTIYNIISLYLYFQQKFFPQKTTIKQMPEK